MGNGYTYRLEKPSDDAAIEVLTREAFWNVYQPGCEEHYIIHSLRGNPAVVTELNYVCEDESGAILGHIFYTRSTVVCNDDVSFPVLTFGPISVLPQAQNKGIGSSLIRMTMKKAERMEYPGILITGNPAYYHRFGFRDASDYGIVFEDGTSFPELMACEFAGHQFHPAGGRLFFLPEFSQIDQEALARFDQRFPAKEKMILPGQLH